MGIVKCPVKLSDLIQIDRDFSKEKTEFVYFVGDPEKSALEIAILGIQGKREGWGKVLVELICIRSSSEIDPSLECVRILIHSQQLQVIFVHTSLEVHMKSWQKEKHKP